jgi:hypothetical protein
LQLSLDALYHKESYDARPGGGRRRGADARQGDRAQARTDGR